MAKRVSKKVTDAKSSAHGSSPGQENDKGIEEQILFFYYSYLKPYGKYVLYSVIIVLLAGGGVSFAIAAQKAEMAKAFDKLAESDSTKELQEIADKHSGSAVGALAAFRVARQVYEDGEYTESAEKFKKFVESYPGHELVPKAKVGRAYALEGAGRLQQAQDVFAEAGNSEQIAEQIRADALIGAARCAKERGEQDKAREFYRSAKSVTDAEMYVKRAESALSRLAEAADTEQASAENGSVSQGEGKASPADKESEGTGAAGAPE